MTSIISTIDHKSQSYDTCGDWTFDKDNLVINVSRIRGNGIRPEDSVKYEFLLALHEFVEANLCKIAGIKEGDVTAFDLQYEANRKFPDYREPGDSEDAPYKVQHSMATMVERTIADHLGIDWNKYEDAIYSLDYYGDKKNEEVMVDSNPDLNSVFLVPEEPVRDGTSGS